MNRISRFSSVFPTTTTAKTTTTTKKKWHQKYFHSKVLMQKKFNSTLFHRCVRRRRHFYNIPFKPSDDGGESDCHENLNLCLADLRNFPSWVLTVVGFEMGWKGCRNLRSQECLFRTLHLLVVLETWILLDFLISYVFVTTTRIKFSLALKNDT